MALKTIKVTPVAHAMLAARARKHGVSAGAVLLDLLNDSNVTVPLEPVQRERWEAAAAACGVSLPQFILLRVEALLYAGGTPTVDEQAPPAPQGATLLTPRGACCKSDAGSDTPEVTP
jgi:hypothetical protein